MIMNAGLLTQAVTYFRSNNEPKVLDLDSKIGSSLDLLTEVFIYGVIVFYWCGKINELRGIVLKGWIYKAIICRHIHKNCN